MGGGTAPLSTTADKWDRQNEKNLHLVFSVSQDLHGTIRKIREGLFTTELYILKV